MTKLLEKLKQKKESIPIGKVSQQQILSFPIYRFNLNSEINPGKFVEICYNYQKEEYKEKESTSILAWRSDYISAKKNIIPEFQDLFAIVENKIKPACDPDYTYSVDHFWFAIYNQGDSAIAHKHDFMDLVCVYYVKFSKNSSPLVIPEVNGEFIITPKEGDLIVFPGECLHFVPESTNDDERIIIAMNVMKRNFLEKH